VITERKNPMRDYFPNTPRVPPINPKMSASVPKAIIAYRQGSTGINHTAIRYMFSRDVKKTIAPPNPKEPCHITNAPRMMIKPSTMPITIGAHQYGAKSGGTKAIYSHARAVAAIPAIIVKIPDNNENAVALLALGLGGSQRGGKSKN
jgi:hypothetical protein